MLSNEPELRFRSERPDWSRIPLGASSHEAELILVSGGVLIIDDYGCWQGARQAVDEFFAAGAPLLTAVDGECRVAVKP